MIYNINNRVSVTLTKHGAKILNQWEKRYVQENNRVEHSDGDVFTSELWLIMEIFGNDVRDFGCEGPLFEYNEINIKDY